MFFKPGHLYKIKQDLEFYNLHLEKSIELSAGSILTFIEVIYPYIFLPKDDCYKFFFDNQFIIEGYQFMVNEPEKYFEEIKYDGS